METAMRRSFNRGAIDIARQCAVHWRTPHDCVIIPKIFSETSDTTNVRHLLQYKKIHTSHM